MTRRCNAMAGVFALVACSLGGSGCAGPRFGDWGRGTPVRESTQTIGVVRVATPWYAPDFVVRSRFRDAVPEYEAIEGLAVKYFILTDDDRFGGVYVWSSRAAAEAYYSASWRDGIRSRRGSDPDLLLLEMSSVIEGVTRVEGEPIGARSLAYPGHAALVLWSADRLGDATALTTTIADQPGLVRAFVVRSATQAGVIALWATSEHAKAGIESLRSSSLGEPVVTNHFEAPVLLDAELRGAREAPCDVKKRSSASSGRVNPEDAREGRAYACSKHDDADRAREGL